LTPLTLQIFPLDELLEEDELDEEELLDELELETLMHLSNPSVQ